MFIQAQETPNPQTLKFILQDKLPIVGTFTYYFDSDLTRAPLIKEIFDVQGIKGVFLTDEFITISKSPEERWEVLRPLLLSKIMDHLVAGKPVLLDDNATTSPSKAVKHEDDELVQQIKELIETRVRPAVAQDGGDIIYHDFKDGVVYLELHGSCSGCPSSTITLKSGIENMLKHYIPEVNSVEAV